MAESTETEVEETPQDTTASELAALRAKNQELLNEAKRAKAQLKNFEGVDPTEYKSLKQQAEEAAQRRALEEGNLESWKKQFTEQFAKEKEPLINENKTLRSALERRLVDAEATAALAAAKGSPKVLLPHIKSHVKVELEDGEYIVHVVDAKGNPRIGDAKGNPMTIAQLVDELRADPDFARNFEGSGSSGGGASRSNASGGGRSTKTIAAGDNDAMLANLDGIIDGSVKIV